MEDYIRNNLSDGLVLGAISDSYIVFAQCMLQGRTNDSEIVIGRNCNRNGHFVIRISHW